MVALQHAILHTISGGHEFHGLGIGDASAVSPRKSAHAVYPHRAKGMIHPGSRWRDTDCPPECHSNPAVAGENLCDSSTTGARLSLTKTCKGLGGKPFTEMPPNAPALAYGAEYHA